MRTYATPPGGLSPQTTKLDERAHFTEAYAYIPADTMRDITTSYLPHWTDMRMWIIARPLSGFAETFSHYIVELANGGGSDKPEPDLGAQAVLFVVAGEVSLTLAGEVHRMTAGGYAYIPPAVDWTIAQAGDGPATFHWIRKAYHYVDGIETPDAFVTHDDDVPAVDMPDCEGVWSTTRFVEPSDLRHDMHVNVVSFKDGGVIPFMETHVMEHGLYVLEGSAEYRLNQNWVSVGPGDYMWLRAFCPQACRATGRGDFRYLLYKDVNRHPALPFTPRR
jgi:(S)-ureidoglycine aminohydrolase